MKTRGLLSKFLVFQLDNTNWSELPEWMRRYVLSCPPSPQHVAARIKDEFHKNYLAHDGCYGRDVAVKDITTQILDRDTSPSFLFLSGPMGIGRKSVAREVYRTLYDGISKHFIEVQYEEFADVVSLHRKLLNFSANWQARAFAEESARFAEMNDTAQLLELASLVVKITIEYNQVLVLDLATHAFDANDRMTSWLTGLMDVLPQKHMPYVIFISNRSADGFKYSSGIFYQVGPLDEENSRYLFKVLINKYRIELPSREEKEIIERSIVGHPGLIATVVNYLRTNPRYKPNRTHNNVVALIRAEVEKMLKDFLTTDEQLRPVVGLFGEAHIISYNEMLAIDAVWPGFSGAAERLIDAGFLQGADGYYQLSGYLRRYSQNLAEECKDEIMPARMVLFASTGDIEEDSFLPLNILDSRIVAHFMTGVPVPGYLSKLIMPLQQLKAARRRYDKQDYKSSLHLSREAYSQSSKLSADGVLESWRLIGLSAVRERDTETFDFFISEHPKIQLSPKREGIYYFAQGFKARSEGNLRVALRNFKLVEKSGFEDAHLHREIAYVFSFDGLYDDAIKHSKIALRLSPLNAYVLDIQVWALLRSYGETRNPALPQEIDECLIRLRDADARDGTAFSTTREKMRDIVVDQSLSALSTAFDNRKGMSIHVKISLLEMLSIKGRHEAYNTMCEEIGKALKSNRNPLADLEFSRIQIIHLAYLRRKEDAGLILNRFKLRFTEYCEQTLMKTIASS